VFRRCQRVVGWCLGCILCILCHKRLRLSAEVDECKPLAPGAHPSSSVGDDGAGGRGLHPFTFQLNLGALCGIGGARRGSVARVEWVLGGVQGV